MRMPPLIKLFGHFPFIHVQNSGYIIGYNVLGIDYCRCLIFKVRPKHDQPFDWFLRQYRGIVDKWVAIEIAKAALPQTVHVVYRYIIQCLVYHIKFLTTMYAESLFTN